MLGRETWARWKITFRGGVWDERISVSYLRKSAAPKAPNGAIFQVLRFSLAIRTYVLKEGHILVFLFHLFGEQDYLPSLFNGTRFLYLVLVSNSQTKAHMQYGLIVTSALEMQLYFHALVMLNQRTGLYSMRFMRNTVNGVLVEMADQLGQNSRDALTKYCSLGPLSIEIQPCRWFNPVVTHVHVSLQLVDVSMSLKQVTTFFESETAPLVTDGANILARNWLWEVDGEKRFFATCCWKISLSFLWKFCVLLLGVMNKAGEVPPAETRSLSSMFGAASVC